MNHEQETSIDVGTIPTRESNQDNPTSPLTPEQLGLTTPEQLEKVLLRLRKRQIARLIAEKYEGVTTEDVLTEMECGWNRDLGLKYWEDQI